jgi:hypothetical protein
MMGDVIAGNKVGDAVRHVNDRLGDVGVNAAILHAPEDARDVDPDGTGC